MCSKCIRMLFLSETSAASFASTWINPPLEFKKKWCVVAVWEKPIPFSPLSFICECASCSGHFACEPCASCFCSLDDCRAAALPEPAMKQTTTARIILLIVVSPVFDCRGSLLQGDTCEWHSSGELRKTSPAIAPAFREVSAPTCGPIRQAWRVTRVGRSAIPEGAHRARPAFPRLAFALGRKAFLRCCVRGRCGLARSPKTRVIARCESFARDGKTLARTAGSQPPNEPRRAEARAVRSTAPYPD